MRSTPLLFLAMSTKASADDHWLWQSTTFETTSTSYFDSTRQSSGSGSGSQPSGSGGSEPFGPKEKGRLCHHLTTSSMEFDVDQSGGLDWNEFYGFVDGVLGAVSAAGGDGGGAAESERHFDRHEQSTEEIGQIYHDMTCECHYTFEHSLSCCHDSTTGNTNDKPPQHPVQVSFEGFDQTPSTASTAQKQYRRNFCDGIMYILESEGVNLWIVADAIEEEGVVVSVGEVEMPVVEVESGGTVVPVTTSPFGIEEGDVTVAETMSTELAGEDLISSETWSTESAVVTTTVGKAEEATITEEIEVEPTTTADETENTAEDVTSDESSTEAAASVSTESTPQATTLATVGTSEATSDEATKDEVTDNVQLDASSVVTLAADEIQDEQSTASSASAGAVMGISFAAIVSLFAAAMAIYHIKREERRRLVEFAGEELANEDAEANSVQNDVVAIDLAGDKVFAELTPENTPDDPMTDEQDGTSDGSASSVFSVDHDAECAQISFEEDDNGSVEARVTVGSALAALGVASIVTRRLSTEQQQEQQKEELQRQNDPNEV